jgi:hypothetical protein
LLAQTDWHQALYYRLRLNRAGVGQEDLENFVESLVSVSDHLDCLFTLTRKYAAHFDLHNPVPVKKAVKESEVPVAMITITKEDKAEEEKAPAVETKTDDLVKDMPVAPTKPLKVPPPAVFNKERFLAA